MPGSRSSQGWGASDASGSLAFRPSALGDMNSLRCRWGLRIAVTLFGAIAAWAFVLYRADLRRAVQRVSSGSVLASTRCGQIEYAVSGHGPPVLVIHGAGGGFDQGMLLGRELAGRGYRAIAVSRFGYLRTPLPLDASPEAQADAHACLLEALGIDRAGVIGVSAGAPSAMQFAIRHRQRCSALVLLVPLAWHPEQPGETSEAPSQAMRLALWGSRTRFRVLAADQILSAACNKHPACHAAGTARERLAR